MFTYSSFNYKLLLFSKTMLKKMLPVFLSLFKSKFYKGTSNIFVIWSVYLMSGISMLAHQNFIVHLRAGTYFEYIPNYVSDTPQSYSQIKTIVYLYRRKYTHQILLKTLVVHSLKKKNTYTPYFKHMLLIILLFYYNIYL